MIGLNFETARQIIVMSRSRLSGTAYIACKKAIKSITSRKNYGEIYKKLKPYISGEKSIRENLPSESFIRDNGNNIQPEKEEGTISEQMSVLGKMVSLSEGEADVFENAYGKSYEDYLNCLH